MLCGLTATVRKRASWRSRTHWPGRPLREGREKAQQRDQPFGIVTGEAFEQGSRQALVIDRRHEGRACSPPERRRREAVTPPPAPSLDRAAIDLYDLGKLLHASPRRAMLQDRDQHDDRGDVYLAAKEAQRRRRVARPAAIDRAAEALPPVVLGGKTAGPAARLPAVSRRVQTAAAGAARGAGRRGEIAIEGEQKVVESGVRQQRCVQGCVPPPDQVLKTSMAKPGRNDHCPCGSGKKYKKCCLAKDEAAEREAAAAARAARDVQQAEKRQGLHEVREALAAGLAGHAPDDVFGDELAHASNAALRLFYAGQLDETEAAARELMARFPDMPDGWEYLGLVHEKRDERRAAADCYRRALELVRRHPEDYEPAFEQQFEDLIARLDPKATA
jgi:tetratricopeptide (TPR) repeat protein